MVALRRFIPLHIFVRYICRRVVIDIVGHKRHSDGLAGGVVLAVFGALGNADAAVRFKVFVHKSRIGFLFRHFRLAFLNIGRTIYLGERLKIHLKVVLTVAKIYALQKAIGVAIFIVHVLLDDAVIIAHHIVVTFERGVLRVG